MKFKGTVSQVSQKDGRYGIKIGEDWFNGFGEPGVKEGNEIEIDYEENGKWKNVTDVKVLDASTTDNGTTNTNSFGRKPESIIKTDCYRMAVDLCIADKIELVQVDAQAETYSKRINEV